jgi:hypothetical protein
MTDIVAQLAVGVDTQQFTAAQPGENPACAPLDSQLRLPAFHHAHVVIYHGYVGGDSFYDPLNAVEAVAVMSLRRGHIWSPGWRGVRLLKFCTLTLQPCLPPVKGKPPGAVCLRLRF